MPEQRLYAIKRPDGSLYGTLAVPKLFTSLLGAAAFNLGVQWTALEAAGWRIVEVKIVEVEHGQ